MSETSVHYDTQPVAPVQPPGTRQRGGCGCGCWIPAVLTLIVTIVLVVVGLFLPPVNLYDQLFGPQYAMLDAQNNAVATEDRGLTLIVDPADAGAGFGASLNAVPAASLTVADPSANPLAAAVQAVPPRLVLQSDLYQVATTGNSPDTFTLRMAVPPDAGNPDFLDVYAWNDDTGEWAFVPAHFDGEGAMIARVARVPGDLALFQAAPPVEPTVLVTVDVTQALTPEVAALATIVAPGGLQPTLSGTLTGSLAAGFEFNAGYLVMPVLRNFADPRALDPETVTALLNSRPARTDHATQITAFASSGYDGVIIDYRGLPADQRDNFTAFIRDLSANLDELGLQLGVVVPAAETVDGTWVTGAYDWAALGAAADFVEIRLSPDPTTFAPGADRLVEAMTRWAVGEINRDKLLLSVSTQSVQQIDGRFTPVDYVEALSALGDVEIDADLTDADTLEPGTEFRARLDGYRAEIGVDEAISTTYIDYFDDDNLIARTWLLTPDALRFRLEWTGRFGLAGAAFNDLLDADDIPAELLDAIQRYKLVLPADPVQARELALRWRIEGSDGLVAETTTDINEELVATIDAPDGNYAVNVEVVDGDMRVPRSGAAVAVFAPTQEPTPVPTAEPTDVPAPTAVAAAPAQPQQAAPPQSSGPVANTAGNIVAGNFEYGGHVTSASTGASGAMRSAGMNWMKVQLRYRIGMSPDAAAGVIGAAHGQGFKILLGVVGEPNELAGGGNYVQQFADFLAGVARLGPDAIEVWNEPNIDREWPTGQISGAAYAGMLQAAYNAIKGANGSVMVISGAPAPTGAEAAFPGQVMNDDRWISELVQAGGLNYMDCLGAHYNEGIVSPTQRSGDPRDNYYTRYFWGMVDTYWNIIGGQKPICFTELGYLTSEGYGPLPSSFAWAQNVTLSQQAAWLAEAAALSSQSGRVRLLIVWNVDFTLYGADPQAGYAMIRPDGSCPACDALARAR